MTDTKLKEEYGFEDDYEDYGVVSQETEHRTESKGGGPHKDRKQIE